MSNRINRRQFIQTATTTTFAMGALNAATTARAQQRESANEKVVAAVLGMGRGLSLADSHEGLPNAEVKYLIDVDSDRISSAAKSFNSKHGRAPLTITDFRRALDDKDVDAVYVATPNHWHAPAGIMAMVAGKHAYVEKPCSHNPREGELLVEAARKHKRKCQMGNQRRSWPKIIEGIQRLHEGVIGTVHYSRAWYANTRGSIGKRNPTGMPPAHLDWDLWQGPAPRVEYDRIYHPYNWHWLWHFGNGECGNNGIHAIDLSRWGLGVDYPIRAAATGGRYYHDDDQETPDTHVVSIDFPGGKTIMWEGQSCNSHGIEGSGFGATFHGDKGAMVMDSSGYTLYAGRHRELEKVPGGGGNEPHQQNFMDAIREDKPLNSEIELGHKSTVLCHLGNIAYRVGRTLHCDPSNGHIKDDAEAAKLWSREYEPGWEPKV